MILSKDNLERSETSITAYRRTSISCYFRNAHLLKWSFEQLFTIDGFNFQAINRVYGNEYEKNLM